MSESIGACPHCGSKDTRLMYGDHIYANCMTCHKSGPWVSVSRHADAAAAAGWAIEVWLKEAESE